MKKQFLFAILSIMLSAFCYGQTQVSLPVTFDDPAVNYSLFDFGGNSSSIVADPVVPANNACKIIKLSTAELWAGTTIGDPAGFSSAIPFGAGATTITMRVYSPDAGIQVRMKVEDPGNPTRSVETEATTTAANSWEVLSFNFANQASGTAALNYSYTYQKLSVFFNFGVTGAVAGEKTYYCDDIQFIPPSMVQVDLPVTFDATNVNYALVDFGGNTSSIVADPAVPTNMACKIIKSNIAEPWAGTTIGGAEGLATVIPFAPGATTMTMRVYSPDAGIQVRMKVEDPGDPTRTVETEATTTVVNSWETLTFNFANQASGTAAINFTYTYLKLSVFFNFGITGAVAGEKTYYCDDIEFSTPTATQVDLPVTFDATFVTYGLVDFGGNASSIVPDPIVPTNKVCKIIKSVSAELWAGTTIGGTIGFANAVPFTPGATKMNIRVYSPDAGIPVRVKLEDPSNATITVETEALTTAVNAWETLEFNFASNVAGTPVINFSNIYQKMSVFFNFGITGAVAGEKTYYFDDVAFGPAPPAQVNLPVTFEQTNVNFALVDFGGNVSAIVIDPVVPANKACKVIKSATAQLWAGTTVGGPAGFANAVPFAPGATRISMRVFSPDAGIPIRMKVEDPANGGISVETEKITTTSNAWETLEFNFASNVSGTPPINFSNNYQKLSVFFNFGTTGAAAGEKTYYFDDIIFLGGVAPEPIDVTFQVHNPDSSLVYIFGSWSGWGNWPGTSMALATADFYSITLTFFPNTNFEYLFVNGANPLKEVLNPAWSCTNGNAQYTNRILSLGSNDTTICLNWGSCNTCLMPVVPINNAVTNVTIGEEESGCYDATETITVAGNGTTFKVLAAGSATMVAGQKITILPGAEVLSGGYFHGYITTTGDYCSVTAVPVSKSVVSEGVSLIEAGELTLKLFPNPASSNVTLDLQGAENCVQTKYEMIGMRGETLRTGNFTGNGKYPISLSGISGGVYYVRIICGDQVVTKMLIKNE